MKRSAYQLIWFKYSTACNQVTAKKQCKLFEQTKQDMIIIGPKKKENKKHKKNDKILIIHIQNTRRKQNHSNPTTNLKKKNRNMVWQKHKQIKIQTKSWVSKYKDDDNNQRIEEKKKPKKGGKKEPSLTILYKKRKKYFFWISLGAHDLKSSLHATKLIKVSSFCKKATWN